MNTTPTDQDVTPVHNPSDPENIKRRRFFYRLMAMIMTFFTVCMIWVAVGVYNKFNSNVGDRRTIESYGFDVSDLIFPLDQLTTANQRDYQPTLGELRLVDMELAEEIAKAGPVAATAEVVDYLQDQPFQRVIVTDDPVIGVVSDDGQARCYPIRYVRWHELINDTVGDTPVLISYSLLTDSSVVFDRRTGGKTQTFGYAGLLYNSNLVFYNVTDDLMQPGDPKGTISSASLFCQMTLGPISGPAAAEGWKLKPLNAFYGRFEDWRAMHPETTVFTGDKTFKDRYKNKPMGNYFDNQKLHFPVEPQPGADDEHRYMDRVMAYEKADGSWDAVDYPLAKGVELPSDGLKIHTVYFGWYAMREWLEKAGKD